MKKHVGPGELLVELLESGRAFESLPICNMPGGKTAFLYEIDGTTWAIPGIIAVCDDIDDEFAVEAFLKNGEWGDWETLSRRGVVFEWDTEKSFIRVPTRKLLTAGKRLIWKGALIHIRYKGVVRRKAPWIFETIDFSAPDGNRYQAGLQVHLGGYHWVHELRKGRWQSIGFVWLPQGNLTPVNVWRQLLRDWVE